MIATSRTILHLRRFFAGSITTQNSPFAICSALKLKVVVGRRHGCAVFHFYVTCLDVAMLFIVIHSTFIRIKYNLNFALSDINTIFYDRVSVETKF